MKLIKFNLPSPKRVPINLLAESRTSNFEIMILRVIQNLIEISGPLTL